jgi:sugar transferase (PEP-CTERM/EpsH1 system associated)
LSRLNVLYIAHRIPYPPNKGDKIRSFNEIRRLSERHNLYLAFLVDEPGDLEHLGELRKYCVGMDYEVIRPLRQKLKSLPYLFTGLPLSVPYFYSKRLQAAIDRRIEASSIEAVVTFSSPMAEYIYKSSVLASAGRRVRLVMDFVDVDSDKWRMYAEKSAFPASVIWRREWKTLMDYEKRIGGTFDVSVFVSEKEAELFRSFCPEANIEAIANGVDAASYAAVRRARMQQPHEALKSNGAEAANGPIVLFMGAMDYFPNEDAILYFHKGIWPRIKAAVPGVSFYVVGSNPSKRLRALSQEDPSVLVTGYVPDTRPYLEKTDVFVAPLRIARGVQNKVLEAMASGVPVVARPEAVQGLKGYEGCIEVRGDEEGFASSVIDLIKRPERRRELAASSERFITLNHSWERNLGRLEAVLAPAQEAPAPALGFGR